MMLLEKLTDPVMSFLRHVIIADIKFFVFIVGMYFLLAIVVRILNAMHRKGLMKEFYAMLARDFKEIMRDDNTIIDLFTYGRIYVTNVWYIEIVPKLIF